MGTRPALHQRGFAVIDVSGSADNDAFIAVDILEWPEILVPLWMLLEERIRGQIAEATWRRQFLRRSLAPPLADRRGNIGRPTTRKSAPARIASVGVAFRDWSSIWVPLGILSGEHRVSNQEIASASFSNRSCLLHRRATTPSTPTRLAKLCEFYDAQFRRARDATSFIAFWSMLVRTVTASKRGRSGTHRHAGADRLPALQQALPPSACTLTSCTPSSLRRKHGASNV